MILLASGGLPLADIRTFGDRLAVAALGLGAAVRWRLAIFVVVMHCLGGVDSGGPRLKRPTSRVQRPTGPRRRAVHLARPSPACTQREDPCTVRYI
jgi:hypothetical protein